MPSNLGSFVYVSGPYEGSGTVQENVDRAMRMAHALMDVHLHPFCPHLCHFLHQQRPRPRSDWMAEDLAWIGQCDYFVRLSGESPGADREFEEARELKLPVFHVVDDDRMAQVARAIRAVVDGQPITRFMKFVI